MGTSVPHKRRKSGQYEYKAVIGLDEFGFVVRRSFYSSKSYADAENKARRYIEDKAIERVLGKSEAEASAISFESLARRWLKIYKAGNVKGNTYYGTYEIPVLKHLIPYFVNRSISSVRHSDIQLFMNTKAKKYTEESVRKMMACLRGIFSLAVADELLAHNPYDGPFTTPRYQKSAVKHAYTRDQRDRILEFAKTHSGGADVTVLLKTGISRSELLGLKWSNLLDSPALSIEQGTVVSRDCTTGNRTIESDGLKNKFRTRTIPIDTELYHLLKNIPRVLELCDGKKKRQVKPEFIFYSPTGKAWDPDNWRRRVYDPFMAAMHEASPDIPILHAHELRHTFTTLAKEDGIDSFYIARICGWSGTKMLESRYGHTEVETMREKFHLK